jgi:hypothetical protein
MPEPAASATPAKPVVVIVSMTGTRRDVLLDYAARQFAAGKETVLVTGAVRAWEPLQPGLSAVGLLPLEQRHWPSRWLLADRTPWIVGASRAIALVARFVARVLPSARGRAFARKAAAMFTQLSRRGRPGRWTRWTRSETARHLRPWLLWRAYLAAGTPGVPAERVEEIVWGDNQSWPVAWHLGRRSPQATITAYSKLGGVPETAGPPDAAEISGPPDAA